MRYIMVGMLSLTLFPLSLSAQETGTSSAQMVAHVVSAPAFVPTLVVVGDSLRFTWVDGEGEVSFSDAVGINSRALLAGTDPSSQLIFARMELDVQPVLYAYLTRPDSRLRGRTPAGNVLDNGAGAALESVHLPLVGRAGKRQ